MGWEDTYLEARALSKKAEELQKESEKLRCQAHEVAMKVRQLKEQAYMEQQEYLDRLEDGKAKGY